MPPLYCLELLVEQIREHIISFEWSLLVCGGRHCMSSTERDALMYLPAVTVEPQLRNVIAVRQLEIRRFVPLLRLRLVFPLSVSVLFDGC